MSASPTATKPTGAQAYLEHVRQFSRNAKLYLLHVIGMDLIHGTWEVLFNLYLLALGFGVEFIGLRLAIQGIAGAVSAVPMGWLSDRLGRKAGFILGDGAGAVMSLIQILSANPVVLLVAPAIGAAFGALHHVTEPAFMAENSEQRERVHLFSVSDGLRTLSAMAGSLIAGFLPLWAVAQFGIDKVTAYRYATFIGILWWFLSLIPAVLLRAHAKQAARQKPSGNPWRAMWSNVKHPAFIAKLLLVNGLISLGAGFVVPLFNVFFHEGVHAHEHEIGATFAAGSLFLALGAFLAPFLCERMGKVSTVVLTRALSLPFIVLIGFAPGLANPAAVVSLAGAAYILRTMLFNMSSPVADAFSMELLDPGERATATGVTSALGSALSAGASLAGAALMGFGDYQSPFFLMALFYLLSTVLFWVLFRGLEAQAQRRTPQQATLAET